MTAIELFGLIEELRTVQKELDEAKKRISELENLVELLQLGYERED